VGRQRLGADLGDGAQVHQIQHEHPAERQAGRRGAPEAERVTESATSPPC
jgi:hypothetical protein